MRFLAILLLLTLSCCSAEALRKRQIQQNHVGFCPMHKFICMIYCPPATVDSLIRKGNGCLGDNECGSDEKCCQPACGCTKKCTKALAKPGFA